ncbi:MAG: flavodoxin family protein [Candidatus Cloacimonetes bacterium]|nr:flavodoxin family protein [Candidatus Cloacimonadota bacterium]
MKVLLINGSPNTNGCTWNSLCEVGETLYKEGIFTSIIQVGNLTVPGCNSCWKCKEIQKCIYDDIVNEVAVSFEKYDGIVLGSPVYFSSANGSLISFLDRLFFSTPFSKTMKVGAAIVNARRGGCSTTFDVLNKYFTISGMPIVSSQYWNDTHGYTEEEQIKDEEGMQTMRVLGRNMAFLIKSIALGKLRLGLPKTEKRIHTNFIR